MNGKFVNFRPATKSIKLWFMFHNLKWLIHIKRNAFESVLMRWMNLEFIMQSKVSQKEKDKYCILLEKNLESLLDCKEIQPVHSEGDQPWDFFGRNDAKSETPVLWPPHAKS